MNKKIVTMGLVGAALCFNAGYAGPNEMPSAERSPSSGYTRPTTDQNAGKTKVIVNGREYGGTVSPKGAGEVWVGTFSGDYVCKPGFYRERQGTPCKGCECGYSCPGGDAPRAKCAGTKFSQAGWEICLDPITGFTPTIDQCGEEPIVYTLVVKYKKKQANGPSIDWEKKKEGCKYNELCDIGELEDFDESFAIQTYQVAAASPVRPTGPR